MINNILAASRIPWILDQKGIELEGNVLRINIEEDEVVVHIYKTPDILKFDNWTFEKYEQDSRGFAGTLNVEFEGISFRTCVGEEELSLIES